MKTENKIMITSPFWKRHLTKFIVMSLTAVLGTVFVVASYADTPYTSSSVDTPNGASSLSCTANDQSITITYYYRNMAGTSQYPGGPQYINLSRSIIAGEVPSQHPETAEPAYKLSAPSGSGSYTETNVTAGFDYEYRLGAGGARIVCALKPQATLSCVSATQNSIAIQLSYKNAGSTRPIRLDVNGHSTATYQDGTKVFTYNDTGFTEKEPLQPGTSYKFTLNTPDFESKHTGAAPDLILASLSCTTLPDPKLPANDGALRAALSCSTTDRSITVQSNYQNATGSNYLGLYQSAYDGNFYDSYLANYADGTQTKSYSSGGYKPSTKYHFYLKNGSTIVASVDCTTANPATITPGASQQSTTPSGTTTNETNSTTTSGSAASTTSTNASLAIKDPVQEARKVDAENVSRITKVVGFSLGAVILVGAAGVLVGYQLSHRKLRQ